MRWIAMVLAGLVMSACNDHPLRPNEVSDWGGPHQPTWTIPSNKVDILLVVDNSPSMRHEQVALAHSADALIAALEHPDVRADYRIGITTTDNGNPLCSESTPEGGDFVFSSCLDRLDEFVSPMGDVDIRETACESICEFTSEQLGITPGRVPWLAPHDGTVGLPEGVSTADALRCLLPQGVGGCGFESPLESMNKSLIRTLTEGEQAFGFLRHDALLLVVFVTDEDDCSYAVEAADVFSPQGDRVFWGDAEEPTSAICWNAGSACQPNGDGSYECEPVNRGVSGAVLEGDIWEYDGDAVLHPLARYRDRLFDVAWAGEGRATQYAPPVRLATISGVGADGEPHYGDGDAAFVERFGIGPGCESEVRGSVLCASDDDCVASGLETCSPAGVCLERQQAVPPQRLDVLAETFDDGGELAYSICEPRFDDALRDIVDSLELGWNPCLPECFADQDRSTVGLVEPECRFTQRVGTVEYAIDECLRDDDGYVVDPETLEYAMPDDDADVCVAYLGDAAGVTASVHDDLPEACDWGNLGAVIARRDHMNAPPGSTVTWTCIVSELPAVDCPD